MKARLALFAALVGLGFVAGAVFNFLHQSQFTKVGPSLAQGIAGGFGMLWVHIGLYLLAIVFLYAAFGWLCAWLAAPVAQRLARNRREAGRMCFLVLLLALIWIALTNAAWYSHSIHALTFHAFAIGTAGAWLRIVLGAVLALIFGAGLLARSANGIEIARARPAPAGIAAVALLLLGGTIGWHALDRSDPFPSDPDRPHVILLGIDGWRPDTLVAHGGPPGVMPFVEDVLAESARVDEALTPLARTYPAWWTVLTGQNPASHGVRFNLVADELIDTPLRLPEQLGERGYHRLLAMDERRFANFRESQGFDRIVGPASGAADFLIGGLNDTPLGNLVISSRLGGWLFPFSHANRAAYFLYRPEVFSRQLARVLDNVPRDPLFLMVHFELPHWPFQWAEPFAETYDDYPLGAEFGHYLEALYQVDRQVEQLFGRLEHTGVLDNAVVVVLSDHGESFPEEDRRWQRAGSAGPWTIPVGHGTHVLGMTQHRVPLAFRGYGAQAIPAGRIRGRASLADVYPTLAAWLGLELDGPVDGESLMPYLTGESRTIPERGLALETGFNPDTTTTDVIDQSRLFQAGFAYYRITASGHLELEPKEIPALLERKSRGVIRGDSILMHNGGGPDGSGALWLARPAERKVYPVADHPETVPPGLVDDFCRIFRRDLDYLPASICAAGGQGD